MHFSAIYLIIKIIIIFKKSTSNVALYIKPSTKAFTYLYKGGYKMEVDASQRPYHLLKYN